VADHTLAGAIVPDTSVVLKWYLHQQEPQRERALALLRAHLEGQVHLMVPDLLPYEAANVLRYKPDWDAARVTQAIDSLFALGLEVVPISATLLQRAVALAYDHDVAVYDAAFVALAEGNGAVFVTADERLVHRSQDLPHVRSLAGFPSA
jgi:predicted nucleic acid-binding protein